jgi:hypothetical protein
MCCYDKTLVNVAAYVILGCVCVCVCVCVCGAESTGTLTEDVVNTSKHVAVLYEIDITVNVLCICWSR